MKRRFLRKLASFALALTVLICLLPAQPAFAADPIIFGFNSEESSYDNTISDTNGAYTLRIKSSDPWDIVTNYTMDTEFPNESVRCTTNNMDGYAVCIANMDGNFKPDGTITVSLTGGQLFSLDSFVCGNGGYPNELTITAGSTSEPFPINASSDILITPSSPVFHALSSFTLSWQDAGFNDSALWFDNFIITPILPQAPTGISLDNASIAENMASGTKVGGLTTTDADSSTFTYSLADTGTYPDNASFTISGSDLLLNTVPDFENKSGYSIRIQTQDESGLTYAEAFLISITNINEAPAFVGSETTMAVNHDAAATDIKSLLHVSDPDSGQTLTWTQASGGAPGHGTLSISGATAVSGGSDIAPGGTVAYTPAAGYSGSDSFTVQVSDGTATDARTISVTVLSGDAGIATIKGLAVAAGPQAGTPEDPKVASVTVSNSISSIVAGDIVPSNGNAAVSLYSNSSYSGTAPSISLTEGANTTLYVKVTAEDTITALYYALTVYREPVYLSAASVTITTPVAGAAPQTASQVEAATANTDYTVTGLTWNEGLTMDGKFMAGRSYSANVTLTSKNFKAFQSEPFTPTVTGLADVSDTITLGTDIGNTVTFTVTYAPTMPLSVTGITVTTQPVKMSYTEIEDGVLALNGMVVTETYNDGTNGTVSFPGGTASGYTASPANGTDLTNAVHNGAKVTVTHTASGQWAQTDALTVNPAPTHGISLDPGADHAFPEALVGYGAQTAHNVTVNSTGTGATGPLTVALGGTNPAAFELSATSISSIAALGSGSFSVAPKTGLVSGNYTATVTVSGDMVVSQSFNISFIVNDTFGIFLNPGTEDTFPEALVGYGAQTAHTVTVFNAGTGATGPLTAALDGTNPAAFELSATSISSIAASGSDSFTIAPKTGLASGTYTATVTVSGVSVASRSIDISFTVNDTFGISLDPGTDYIFPAADVGYGAQAAYTVTVNNAGSGATGPLTVALGGTNPDAFDLSATSILSLAPLGSNSFAIMPKTGLAAGNYAATVTVSGGLRIAPQSLNVSFKVNYVMSEGVLEEQADSTTTITVEGLFAEEAHLIVVPIADGDTDRVEMEEQLTQQNAIAAYEVHVEPAEAFQPPLTLTFAVGQSFNGRTVYILHKLSNGSTDIYNPTVSNGEAVITVNELSPFLLAVDPAVIITLQPQSALALIHQTATFRVEATGLDPFTYQWQRRTGEGAVWEDISGATGPGYTTSSLNMSHNGYQYRVIVTDVLGNSVTSDAAVLTVTSSPDTGDDSQPFVYVILTALFAMAVIMLLRRRRMA